MFFRGWEVDELHWIVRYQACLILSEFYSLAWRTASKSYHALPDRQDSCSLKELVYLTIIFSLWLKTYETIRNAVTWYGRSKLLEKERGERKEEKTDREFVWQPANLSESGQSIRCRSASHTWMTTVIKNDMKKNKKQEVPNLFCWCRTTGNGDVPLSATGRKLRGDSGLKVIELEDVTRCKERRKLHLQFWGWATKKGLTQDAQQWRRNKQTSML